VTRAAAPVLTRAGACAPPGSRRAFLPPAPPAGVTCHQPPWGRLASAAALLVLAGWCTPELPLYGDDHDRGDFAP
jgi:hypothetical protein